MSASEARDLVRLRIEPATALTEITVTDARFRKVDLPTNTGVLELQLPRGVYEIGFREGTSTQRELAVLSMPGKKPVLVQQPAGAILPSVAPLEDHDPDISEDVALATQAPPLAVVVRDASEQSDFEPSGGQQRAETRLAGLSIIDASGARIQANEASIRETSSRLPLHAPPGWYRLRLETGVEDQAFEMPLVVCPGWKTRLYCGCRPYQCGDYRADLTRVQVRMAPADGSRRRSRDERNLETIALMSLAGRRTLSGSALNDLLRRLLMEKYVNPMFGFYAGYLLRGIEPEEIGILTTLLAHLEELIATGPERNLVAPPGFRHPDVEALKLRLGILRDEEQHVVEPLPFPPMLAAGWRTVLQVAERSKSLIPEGSLSDRISSRLVAAGAFTVWAAPSEPPLASAAIPEIGLAELLPESSLESRRRGGRRTAAGNRSAPLRRAALPFPEQDQGEAPPLPADEAMRVVNAAFHDVRLREWFRAACGMEARANNEDARKTRAAPIVGPEEKLVAQAIHPIAPKEEFQNVFERMRIAPSAGYRERTLSELAAEIRLPITTVERAVQQLSEKLLEQGQLLNVDLRARSTMARPELIIPYDPNFLGDGFTVPIPRLSDTLRGTAFAEGAILDYTHFSLVMHAERRVAIVTAHNVDASRSVRVKGGLKWRMDERVGDRQLGPETYDANQLDKGHLVRREDVLWGTVTEAKLANKATFFYTNAAPQHKNFNQDEWVTLEDWVLDNATDFSYRLCVFTGPVLRSNDPVLTDLPPQLRTAFPTTGPAQIPAAFWKVVVLRDAQAGGDDLSVVCFAMRQSEMWNDREGKRLLSLKVHQVTLGAIEGWTGLDFGELKNADELTWSEERTRSLTVGEEPEWPLVRGASDIVFSGPSRRLRGLRAAKGGRSDGARSIPSARSMAHPGASVSCGCAGPSDFDAREAIAALSRDVTRLTEVVAAQARLGDERGEAQLRTRSGGARGGAMPAADSPSPLLAASDDERVRRMVGAAPDGMKQQVEEFARKVVLQADVASGAVPAPAPTELERIVGGNRVQTGAMPSCVCIGDATGWFCTGVVIAPQVVLTAAHCGAGITRILIGDETIPNLRGRIVAVRQVVVHPSYRAHPHNENDVNLLILATPAAVPPVPLATAAQLSGAKEVHLVGFGYNDPQLPKGFGVKREVRAPMGPMKRSPADDLSQFEALTGFHAEYEFIAGRKGLGKDTCNGDSGGPAYIHTTSGPVVAGLTSRATRDANVPCGAGGIYVRTDSFRDWINGVLARANVQPLP